jgi:predicted transcriptional regulator
LLSGDHQIFQIGSLISVQENQISYQHVIVRFILDFWVHIMKLRQVFFLLITHSELNILLLRFTLVDIHSEL